MNMSISIYRTRESDRRVDRKRPKVPACGAEGAMTRHPAQRPRAQDPVRVAMRLIEGEPARAAEVELLGKAARGRGLNAHGDGSPLLLPGLAEKVPAEDAVFVERALALWALLLLGERARPSPSGPARKLLEEVWGARAARTSDRRKLLSVPVALLRREERDAATRCVDWFHDHLRQAGGRDPLANWVLVRLPRVWLIPSRDERALAREGSVSLAAQVDRWLPAPDADLEARPRRAAPTAASRRRAPP